MTRIKGFALATVLVGFFLFAFVPVATSDDCSGTCDKQISKDALNLPSPDAKSIHEYGSRLVDDIGKCLDCARKEIFDGPNNAAAGTTGSSSNDSTYSSSGNDNSNSGSSTDSSQ